MGDHEIQDAQTRQTVLRQRRHLVWLWIAVLVAALVLVLLGRSAAAQTERGTEIIERALALEGHARDGARLYKAHCASCHGRKAHGDAAKVVPSLAGQTPLYLIKQLADVAEADRNVPEMHRIVARKDLATPQAIKDISSYLTRLSPDPRPEHGDGTQLALGKRYYQGLCAFCHGARGEGNDPHATPALQRQHYSYLLMETRRLAVGHRYSVDIRIIETLERLPFDYLAAIADYASRLPADAPTDPAATAVEPPSGAQVH